MNETKREVRILIAEDDEGHAELIQDSLKEAGVTNEIIRFRDGQETIDYIMENPDLERRPCLLLLDIRMPRMDGIDVLKRLKSDPRTRNMPVIMLTTTDDPREIRQCYDLGCNCYVTKPVDYQKFSEVMNRLGLFLVIIQIPDPAGA
ncbi:MAG: response regulator [Desulfuromonadia bacterium]